MGCGGGGRGQLGIEEVLPGSPAPRAAGLRLVANRWPAVLSLQFVLPGSPASHVQYLLSTSSEWKGFFSNELQKGTVHDLYLLGLSYDGTSYTGRTLLLANDGRANISHQSSALYHDFKQRGTDGVPHRAAGSGQTRFLCFV